MDTYVSEENSKRPRLFEGESDGEKTDRISTLPDDILNSILSILPTKYAVATSILSTRWKYLWTSVHSLDFGEYLRRFTMTTSTSYMERHNGFIDFVDRVMQLNNAPYIHKFSFNCFECDSPHFNKWISTLLWREVQELILQIPNPPSCMFPHCFFNSDSLRVLILKMYGSMKIPSSICFSRLKVLHFINIKFSVDQPMQEISFSFPLLEECVLHECRWYKTKTINISSPKLRILTIVDEKDSVSRCKIMIYAESLVSLKLETYLAYEYTLCNLLSLVDASIDVTSENTPQRSRVRSLFRGLANVRNLELPGNVIKTLSLPKVLDDVLTLSCLIHLKVVCSEYGLSATTGGRELAHVLNKMPNVQSLSFPEGLDLFNDEKRGSKIKVVSPCFLPHLKSIDIRQFS